jgi:hypothetical protein
VSGENVEIGPVNGERERKRRKDGHEGRRQRTEDVARIIFFGKVKKRQRSIRKGRKKRGNMREREFGGALLATDIEWGLMDGALKLEPRVFSERRTVW